MKHPFRLALSAFLILISIMTVVQAQSGDPDTKLIEQILEEFPVEAELKGAPEDIRNQFSQNPLGLPPSKNEQMIDHFAKAFNTDSLVKDVENIFSAQFDSDHAETTMAWLKEESTQKVTEAKREFNTLQGARKRIVRMYEMEQDPPNDERRNIIQSYIDIISAGESAVESQVILFRSIVSAFSILSDQRNLSESQIDGFVENYRQQIRPEVMEEITNQHLIVYYDIEDDSLNEYTSFYETEAGNWLNTTLTEGIHAAYQNAADRFIDSVRSD